MVSDEEMLAILSRALDRVDPDVGGRKEGDPPRYVARQFRNGRRVAHSHEEHENKRITAALLKEISRTEIQIRERKSKWVPIPKSAT
jgi:hypothetical protein